MTVVNKLKMVATGKESLQVEPVAWMLINTYGEVGGISYEDPMGDMLEGWTCKPLYEAELDEPCFCDRKGIGAAGVSCGDCPTRDYKNTGR
jgi:hypothetical protein